MWMVIPKSNAVALSNEVFGRIIINKWLVTEINNIYVTFLYNLCLYGSGEMPF